MEARKMMESRFRSRANRLYQEAIRQCRTPGGLALFLTAGLGVALFAILAGMTVPNSLVTALLLAWVALAAAGLRAAPPGPANP
jgi:hypothetical protein